jgi:NADH-quinone oxidoreductase subunit L
MEYFFQIVIAIFVLPMLAAGVQLFFGRKLPRYGDWLPTGAMGIALLLSLILLIPRLLQVDPDFLKLISFEWLHVQNFVLPMGLWIDNLTLIMLSMICLVSFLVHLFSIGYLRGDANLPRFFAFLAFFSAAMLGLVVADNLLLFFVFWELMGLASYLLISFWHDKPSAADASLKAFLTTKIGDFGLFLGILILYKACGSFHFMDIFNKVAQGGVDHNMLTLAGLFLFLGVVGKSAQFPLHIWLPDAMEAPTPVSALLHAATMVAAGVYLLGRMYPILTPEVLTTLAYVGAITAFVATLMAVVMFDIKKVLAYSTISQLGYMVVGVGTGGVSVGLFHLITHAFFKALLFLGSGSVIHAVHSQDMRDMGGLRKKMPLTFWTFLLGMLALCGLPLFSGFYSKDGIIAAALGFRILHPQHFLPFVLVLGGAALTAFYMTRLMFMTFLGQGDAHKLEHAHESPPLMAIPLVVLAVLAVVSGYGNWFESYVPSKTAAHYAEWNRYNSHDVVAVENVKINNPEVTVPATEEPFENHVAYDHAAVHREAMALSIVMVICGLFIGYMTYGSKLISAEKVSQTLAPLHRVFSHKFYVDELLYFVGVRSTLVFSAWLMSWRAGMEIIDGLWMALAGAVQQISRRVSQIQTGNLREYLWVSFAGAAVALLVLFIIYVQ